MPIYDRPVRLLMRDMVEALRIYRGEIFDRERAIEWFRQNYPLIKTGTINAHLVRLSVNAPSRLHYSPRPSDDDVFFQVDGSHFRLYDPPTDPAPITRASSDQDVARSELARQLPEESSEFAYERDLREFLARHLERLEPGLRLYQDEDINGVEFPVGGRSIDILALDRANNFVVIELKVSRGYDRAVGQLLRYMGWIEQHQADAGQTVRGFIVAKAITEDLKLACFRVTRVTLFEYDLSVTIRRIDHQRSRMGA